MRTADQYNNAFDKDFTIAVADVREHVARDFNGDGVSDILLRSDGGTVVSWDMAGGQPTATHDFGVAATNWKIAVFAPMPSASERIATEANPGFSLRSRTA